MSHQISWYVENKIVLARYSGDMSMDETLEAFKIVRQYVENSPEQTVHYLADVTEVTSFPTNIAKIINIRDELAIPPQLGWIIAFGSDNRLLNFVLSVFGQALRMRVRTFKNLDEAIVCLRKVDATLPLTV